MVLSPLDNDNETFMCICTSNAVPFVIPGDPTVKVVGKNATIVVIIAAIDLPTVTFDVVDTASQRLAWLRHQPKQIHPYQHSCFTS